MKILLLNENPVVNKLVTLSAQKTSDELEIAHSLDEIKGEQYDLLVVDDTLYNEEVMDALKSKIKFSKSLYIYSKAAKQAEGFTSTLKKPFLPTDLVELFSFLGKDIGTMKNDEEEFLLDEGGDDLSLESLDDISLDSELSLEDDELSLDDVNEDALSSLDDDLSFDEELDDSVLDDEEVQEVQSLLDDTDEAKESLDDDLSFDDELSDELPESLDDSLSFDDELEETTLDDNISDEELSMDDNLEEDDSFEDEIVLEEAEQLDESLDDENIETQIEDALENITPEELESEVDEETLLDIASDEINSLDALNDKDIKMALGEELDDLPSEELVESDDAVSEEILEAQTQESSTNSDVDGVEALKNLLKVLSDNNVAASLKGMKININITLGDN